VTADVITSHAELLDRIRVAYDDYSNLIGTFSESALTKEATVGTWSVRDVIAHIGGDERWMAGQLEALRTGEQPTAESCYGADLSAPADMDWSQDGRNAWQRQRLAGLSLDDVRTMASEGHARLLAVISTFGDEQLGDRLAIGELTTVGWIRPPTEGEAAYPLWEWVRGVTYHHYADHANAIRDAIAAGDR
jgi:hypothetical protein